eukprot:6126667-Amphidinium_carterae.1
MHAVDVDEVPRHNPLYASGLRRQQGKVIGHTFRVTGAQHLAQQVIDIPTIMVMSRWKFNIVLCARNPLRAHQG